MISFPLLSPNVYTLRKKKSKANSAVQLELLDDDEDVSD